VSSQSHYSKTIDMPRSSQSLMPRFSGLGLMRAPDRLLSFFTCDLSVAGGSLASLSWGVAWHNLWTRTVH
jgi:hypothetical protein